MRPGLCGAKDVEHTGGIRNRCPDVVNGQCGAAVLFADSKPDGTGGIVFGVVGSDKVYRGLAG